MILFDSSVVIDARDPDSPFHDWEFVTRDPNRVKTYFPEVQLVTP